MTEFELLHRGTLDLNMTFEKRDYFKTKLKNITESSFKLFSGNCKLENDLSTRNKFV